MKLDTRDTIAALATAPGPGGRAIVRLSGPDALKIAQRAAGFTPAGGPVGINPTARMLCEGHVELPDLPTLPADFYYWQAPKSYTGQDVVELHTLSCPPLIDVLIAELLKHGARAAQPG